MKNVTRLSLLVLAMSAIAPVANSHMPYQQFAGWVTGSYYKPSNNGLSVGDLLFANAPGNNFDGGHREVFLNPSNDYDYALGFSYRFPHTNTRLFISYDHYDNDIDDHVEFNLRSFGFAPGVVDPVLGEDIIQTQAVIVYDLSSSEFRAGAIHDLRFGDRFRLDLLAFLEYSRVRQTLDETIIPTFVVEEEVNAPLTENKFEGFGPGVGFMTRWSGHCPEWHVFAGGNTTLLYSSHHYTQTNIVNDTNFYIYEPETSHSVVGKIDIEFGINYHHALKYELHGMQWDISLGMRYLNLFNALKNGNTAFNPNAGANNNVVANFAPNLGPAQDWGRYGPFLRFKLGGAYS